MPLVLTQNEVVVEGPGYADQTGVLYHFPQRYRARIQPGEPFVYYRGVRRAGGKRGMAEYFGAGVIGEVQQDPSTNDRLGQQRLWFAEILGYQPFPFPVSAIANGRYLESVQGRRHWSSSVRSISPQLLANITRLGMGHASVRPPPIDQVEIPAPVRRQAHAGQANPPGNEPKADVSGGLARRSNAASLIGTRGEEVAWRALCALPETSGHRWLSREGVLPGYDMSFVDARGALHAVEIKSTIGARIDRVEMTAAEWACAARMREHYHLWLILGCMSTRPRIETIADPFAAFGASAQPLAWLVRVT